jgi:transposase-like protein
MREGDVARWRERLDRFASTGHSIAEFCRAEGVSQASFYKWRKRLGETAEASSVLSFIEVAPVEATMFEVVLRSGIVVRVPERHAPDALEQLLDVVERRG